MFVRDKLFEMLKLSTKNCKFLSKKFYNIGLWRKILLIEMSFGISSFLVYSRGRSLQLEFLFCIKEKKIVEYKNRYLRTCSIKPFTVVISSVLR